MPDTKDDKPAEPAKPAAPAPVSQPVAKDAKEAAKDPTKEPPHADSPAAPTFAKIPHQDAVREGVEAAVSHRQTTKDVVETERKPFKAPAPHPLVGKMVKLMDKVADLAKKHKEEVLDLRAELQELMFEVPGDMPGHSLHSFNSVVTQVEGGINMLDPDCTARAPG